METVDTPLVGSRPLPDIQPDLLVADTREALEHCRSLADWARRHGYLAILAPSAAREGEDTLAIYPENRPLELSIEFEEDRIPLNYGPDAFIRS